MGSMHFPELRARIERITRLSNLRARRKVTGMRMMNGGKKRDRYSRIFETIKIRERVSSYMTQAACGGGVEGKEGYRTRCVIVCEYITRNWKSLFPF